MKALLHETVKENKLKLHCKANKANCPLPQEYIQNLLSIFLQNKISTAESTKGGQEHFLITKFKEILITFSPISGSLSFRLKSSKLGSVVLTTMMATWTSIAFSVQSLKMEILNHCLQIPLVTQTYWAGHGTVLHSQIIAFDRFHANGQKAASSRIQKPGPVSVAAPLHLSYT